MGKLKWEMTRSNILAAQVPANTNSYTAIPHRVFLEELQEELSLNGYIIDRESYMGTKGYQIMTGSFTIKKPSESGDVVDIRPAIYFQNSYNKAKVASVKVGAKVLVCSNGMIGMRTKAMYTRKHTGTALADVREHMKFMVERVEEEFAILQKNTDEMKQLVLSRDVRAQLVGDMIINEQMITAEQISILRREMSSSVNFKDNSLWSFYNNCTEAFKNTHPTLYQNQHLKLHAYISDKFGLTGAPNLYKGRIETAHIIQQLEIDEII